MPARLGQRRFGDMLCGMRLAVQGFEKLIQLDLVRVFAQIQKIQNQCREAQRARACKGVVAEPVSRLERYIKNSIIYKGKSILKFA